MIDEANGKGIKIIISNLLGDALYNSENPINKGLNQFNIDVSQYVTGTYVYSVTMDNVLMHSGKFNIIR